MSTHADKTQKNKNHSAANATAGRQISATSSHQLADNRPEAIFQRKLLEITKSTPQLKSGSTGIEPIQRAIIVDGKLLTKIEHLEASGLNAEEMLEAIQEIDSLPNRPKTIQDATNDLRLFYLTKNGGYYETDVTKAPERGKTPTDRLHQEVNTAPDFISRGEQSQTMRISGLISCIAIFIEAADNVGTQRLIGMHYTTGYHTEKDKISSAGLNALQLMVLLTSGLKITRVHLCHRLQINQTVHEAATVNLRNLRAYFGDGNCQTHVLGQRNDVTARLAPTGNVGINV
jgi:hypothetical protein